VIDSGKLLIYFGYAMAAIFCCLGIVVLSGLLLPPFPETFRITLGIVLMLYAIYRFITTRIKSKQTNEDRFTLQ
jgi:hypothetical protein